MVHPGHDLGRHGRPLDDLDASAQRVIRQGLPIVRPEIDLDADNPELIFVKFMPRKEP